MKLTAFILIILTTSLVSSLEIPNPQDHYVNDFAHVLSPADVETLRTMFTIVEENTTVQLVFVSMESIGPEVPSDYALAIGEKWSVGQEETDNGLVILYVKDIGKIWVSVGYGLEGTLPDSKVGRLLDEHYVPLRDEGSVSEGIREFSFAISQEIVNAYEGTLSRSSGKIPIWPIILGLMVLIVVIYVLSKSKVGRFAMLPILIPRTGGGYSGGTSFGGGSFGGGGAGR